MAGCWLRGQIQLESRFRRNDGIKLFSSTESSIVQFSSPDTTREGRGGQEGPPKGGRRYRPDEFVVVVSVAFFYSGSCVVVLHLVLLAVREWGGCL